MRIIVDHVVEGFPFSEKRKSVSYCLLPAVFDILRGMVHRCCINYTQACIHVYYYTYALRIPLGEKFWSFVSCHWH